MSDVRKSEYFGWYAVELRMRLGAHFPAAHVETVAREALSHLGESAERMGRELGMAPDAAALAAIEAFGSPEQVALAHMRKSPAKLLGLPAATVATVAAIVALLCWDYHWLSLQGPFDNYGATWQNGLCGIIGFAALAALVIGVNRARRSLRLRLSIVGLGAAVLLPLIASALVIQGPFDYEGVPRYQARQAELDIPDSIATLDRLVPYLNKGSQAWANAKSAADVPAPYRNPSAAIAYLGLNPNTNFPNYFRGGSMVEGPGIIVPRPYVMASYTRGMWALETQSSFAEAKHAWAKNSAEALGSIKYSRDRLVGMLDLVRQARTTRVLFFNPPMMLNIFTMTTVFLIGLLLLDGVAFALARRRRKLPLLGIA